MIRTRLTVWYAAAITLTLVVVAGITWIEHAASLRRALDEALRVQVDDARFALADVNEPIRLPEPAKLGIFTVVFDHAGRRLAASPGAPPALGASGEGAATIRLSDEPAAYAIVAGAAAGERTIVAGASLAAIDSSLEDLAGLLVALGLASGLGSLLGGWWLAGRALRPVDQMTREAAAIGSTDLDRRIPQPPRADELGRLATTLNSMLDRVEAAVRRERDFIAAASHDLRTPIASLRTELELAERQAGDPAALRAAVQAAHADAVRLGDLASDLLRLAEAEPGGRVLLRRPVSVRDLLDAVVGRVRPVATARDIRVDVAAPDGLARVDRVRMEQAVGNVVANAIRESPAGGTVEVAATLDGSAAASNLEIVVSDRGPGVPADQRTDLFRPFRHEARRPHGGSRLGLATASAAVRAHGGEIGYRDRPGGGAIFWIRVPA